MILSISEIDLLSQQLSSCWNAPAGAVINVVIKLQFLLKLTKYESFREFCSYC